MSVPPAEALLVLARAPRPGQVKTRLIPVLGQEGACQLHISLLRQTLATGIASGRPVFCFTDGPVQASRLDPSGQVHWLRQPQGHLGWRMQSALARMHARAARLVLVGSDCAVLSNDYLEGAFAALEDADFVLGPAEDGGYVLIGSALPSSWLGADRFIGVRFGGAHARADTLAALAPLGRISQLEPLWDIDDTADLRRARQSAILRRMLTSGETG